MEPCPHCSDFKRKRWVYHTEKCPKKPVIGIDFSSKLDYSVVTEFFHPVCQYPGCKEFANPIPGPNTPGQHYCLNHNKEFHRKREVS